MTIQTVLKGTKSNFIKATIYTRDLEAFKALGFVESDILLPDEEEKRDILTLKDKQKGAHHDSKRTNP